MALILGFVDVPPGFHESTRPAETRKVRSFKAKIEGSNPSGVTTSVLNLTLSLADRGLPSRIFRTPPRDDGGVFLAYSHGR